MWGTAQLSLSDRGTQSSSSWEWWPPVASGIALCWRDCLVQAYTSSSRAAHVRWEVNSGVQRPGPFLSYLKSVQLCREILALELPMWPFEVSVSAPLWFNFSLSQSGFPYPSQMLSWGKTAINLLYTWDASSSLFPREHDLWQSVNVKGLTCVWCNISKPKWKINIHNH